MKEVMQLQLLQSACMQQTSRHEERETCALDGLKLVAKVDFS